MDEKQLLEYLAKEARLKKLPSFLLENIKEAFHGAKGVCELIGLIALLVAWAWLRFGAVGSDASDLVGKITLWTFAVVFVFHICIWIPFKRTKKAEADRDLANASEKSQRDRSNAELIEYQTKKQTEQEDRRSKAFYGCVDALKNGTSIQALQVVAAADVLENSDVVFVCNKLVEWKHEHPFDSVKDLLPESEYLNLLLRIRASGERVREQQHLIGFMLDYWVKRPSSVFDKVEPPPSPAS